MIMRPGNPQFDLRASVGPGSSNGAWWPGSLRPRSSAVLRTVNFATVSAAGQIPISRPHAPKSHIRHRAPPAGCLTGVPLLETLLRDTRDQPLAERGERRALGRAEMFQEPADDALSGSSHLARHLDAGAVRVIDRDRASPPGALVASPSATRRSTTRTAPEVGQPDNLAERSH